MGVDSIPGKASSRISERSSAGRLSMYWPLRSFLPVPQHWCTRLALAVDGDLIHRACIVGDTEVVEGILDETLVVQAFFVHLPGTHGPDPLAWEVVNLLRLPHSAEQRIGSPDLNTAKFCTVPLRPTSPDLISATSDADSAAGLAGDTGDSASGGRSVFGEDGLPSGLTHTTVVYASAALPASPGPDDVSAAVDEIEKLVHTTARALHAVTGMGQQLPTLASTKLEVLIALDELVDGALEARWNIGHYTTRGLEFELRDVADDTIADALTFAELDATQHSFRSLISDLQRQAVVAARRHGDTRTAVVMAAATCEAWVDLMAGALLWEEGATPENAAQYLTTHRNLRDRLHQLLAPRLGGAWDIRTTPALHAWDVDIRAARNRVLHAGGLPSAALAERSINAMYDFLTLTLDRLCSDTARNRHPVAAVLMANRVGLESRNGWTKRIRGTATEMDRDDLRGTFDRWYAATSQLLLAPPMQVTPVKAQLQMVALTDGRTYWIERDPRAALARLARLATRDAQALKVYRPDTSDGVGKTVSFDVEVPFQAVGAWMAEHNLVPGAAVMRDVSTWQRPPAAPPTPA